MSSSNNNNSKIAPHNGNKRRSSRRSASPIPPRRLTNDANAVAAAPAAKKSRTSLRHLKYCCDIDNIPHEFKCNGCARWDASKKIKPRDEMKTREYQCCRAWTLEEDDVPERLWHHYQSIVEFIEATKNVHRSALVEEEITTTTNNNDQPPIPTPSPPTVPAPRNITMEKHTFYSQGQYFEFSLPSSHVICHISDVKRWQNGCDAADRVKAKFKRLLYRTDCLFTQSLWAIACSAVPSLALSAAQFLSPLIVLAFLYDTGIFNDGVPSDTFPKSFPSDATLRKYTINQAVRETISLSKKLIDLPVYLACDKGNKKGISHFVKILCWWSEGEVQTQVLDIDASGGTTEECADAIEASMNKLKANDGDPTHLLHGQGTDSGGGGVLEGLAVALQTRNNLCIPSEDDYLVANCCIHALQLQLSNAIKTVFGEGGLEKANMMQMLHTVYDLQEAIDMDEWRHMLWRSTEFVHSFDATKIAVDSNAIDQLPSSARNRNTFYQSYAKVLSLHSKFNKNQPVDPSSLTEYKETIYAKVTAPILTRWWTVGAGASYLFEYYLPLYHVCQSIINSHSGESKANRIASALYALMSDQENFIDLCLVRCFNKAYIHPHLRWLQACTDLTNNYGFQPHNIAVRYYMMDVELEHLCSYSKMGDYFEAIRGVDLDKKHMKKLEIFMTASRTSLNKHFKRWLSPKLLPAALMSESPLAKVIAAVILKRDMPTNESFGDLYEKSSSTVRFSSAAHGLHVNITRFNRFVRAIVDDDVEYPAAVQQAASAVLEDFDMRNKDYSQESDNAGLRLLMHTKYLSLPSQTQFVESGVKDAKNVSATDRSEQVRTCMSVVRSATPLGKAETDANANKIRAIISSTVERINPHIIDSRDDAYKQRFQRVLELMTKGHFKQERKTQKIVHFESTASKYKKPNKNQAPKEQQQTAAVTGLLPYGKLVKARNMLDLEEELVFRGVAMEDVPKSITDRKIQLKALECKRLMDAGVDVSVAKDQSDKHFMKQSEAVFKLTND